MNENGEGSSNSQGVLCRDKPDKSSSPISSDEDVSGMGSDKKKTGYSSSQISLKELLKKPKGPQYRAEVGTLPEDGKDGVLTKSAKMSQIALILALAAVIICTGEGRASENPENVKTSIERPDARRAIQFHIAEINQQRNLVFNESNLWQIIKRESEKILEKFENNIWEKEDTLFLISTFDMIEGTDFNNKKEVLTDIVHLISLGGGRYIDLTVPFTLGSVDIW